MSDKQPGYVLHADQRWLDHHNRFSVGGRVVYCRGAGAPMKNVARGGMLYFIPTLDPPKRVVARAAFAEFEVRPVSEAWEYYGLSLGATSFDHRCELASRIDSVRDRHEIGLIVSENYQPYSSPVTFSDAGVKEVDNASKGWSIGAVEVERLLR